MKKLTTILFLLSATYCKAQTPYDSAMLDPMYGFDKLDTIHQNAVLRNMFKLHLLQNRLQITNDSINKYVTTPAIIKAIIAANLPILKAAGYKGDGSLQDFNALFNNYPQLLNIWPNGGTWYYTVDKDSIDRILNEINFYKTGLQF